MWSNDVSDVEGFSGPRDRHPRAAATVTTNSGSPHSTFPVQCSCDQNSELDTGLIAIMISTTAMAEKRSYGSAGLFQGDSRERLASIVEAMREMSLQTEPAEMVRAYGAGCAS